jgi:hypothetical protein
MNVRICYGSIRYWQAVMRAADIVRTNERVRIQSKPEESRSKEVNALQAGAPDGFPQSLRNARR